VTRIRRTERAVVGCLADGLLLVAAPGNLRHEARGVAIADEMPSEAER
jgi:hypothetical protein